jgi:dipeptidyl aminopeptidase/acylaminoacyl peptidase
MNTNMSRFLLVWMLAAAIFASSILVILQPSMPNQSAFATFPGNNGLIAFSKDGEIFTMNADGSDQHNISNDPGFDYAPSWSPDGTKIAFTRGGEIYVMNADGSDQQRLTNNAADDGDPSWSPDGTKIAYSTSGHGGFEIYVMNADGSNPQRLTNNPYLDMYPNWSPDGTKIAFETDRDEPNHNREIYVMNADGSDQHNISNNVATADMHPDWGTHQGVTPTPDTTPPVVTVPEDMMVEATGPDGAQVSFEEEPSATDDVDGPVDVTCDYNSGDTFPIGETVVTCSAEDTAGNSAEETFTVTVQDTTDPDVEITQVVDRRNRVLAEGDMTPTPYVRVTFEATDAVGIENTECSLDGQQPFTSCTNPVVYDRLSRGTHQVTVRATDEAGNTGEDRFLFTIGSPSAATAPGRP